MVMRGFSAGGCMETLNWLFCWASSKDTFFGKDFGRKVGLRIEKKKGWCERGGLNAIPGTPYLTLQEIRSKEYSLVREGILISEGRIKKQVRYGVPQIS
jgi:hypothetical protein